MMSRDKVFHFAMGVLAIVCALVALFINAVFGLGPMLAYTTTTVGVLYELQQWVRKEGQPDVWDAVATAAPGFIAWIILANWK
jgi:hypothetical protein